MTEPIHIPIDMGIKAKANLTLTNTVTGEVQTMSMGAPEGMILDHYLDWAMQQGLGLLGEVTFNRCYLGTGNTPVQPTDTGLSGSQLAMSSTSVLSKNLIPTNQKFEMLNTIENIGIGPLNQMATTPDEEILLIGNDSESLPNLRAYKINKETWNLSLLEIPDFSSFSPNSGSCQGLSCGGNYLFVGLSYSPYGKLFKRDGDNFIFVSDVPGLSESVFSSSISSDGRFLIVTYHTSNTSNPKSKLFEINPDGNLDEVGTLSFGLKHAYTRFFSDNIRFCLVGRMQGTSNHVGFCSIYRIEHTGDIVEEFFAPNIASSSNHIGWGLGIFSDSAILWSVRSETTQGTLGFRLTERSAEGVWSSRSLSQSVLSGCLIALGNRCIVTSGGGVGSLGGGESAPITSNATTSFGGSVATLDNSSVVILRLEDAPLETLGFFKIRDMNNIQSYARKWTFPAGTGTGVVNEIAIQATSGTGGNGNSRYFLRFVLPEGFEKTDLHQLEVEVEAEIENPGVWEGVIPGGSRDGSDVSYRITMSENQFSDFITTGYNNLSSWFGASGTPNVRIGTSNEESDLVFDRENIRGEEIEYISSTAIREVIPYEAGSLERTIRLFLEIDQGNGKIGEIVFGDRFCRVTFDPPLNKYDPEGVDAGRDPSTRLYMNLVFGWKREEE